MVSTPIAGARGWWYRCRAMDVCVGAPAASLLRVRVRRRGRVCTVIVSARAAAVQAAAAAGCLGRRARAGARVRSLGGQGSGGGLAPRPPGRRRGGRSRFCVLFFFFVRLVRLPRRVSGRRRQDLFFFLFLLPSVVLGIVVLVGRPDPSPCTSMPACGSPASRPPAVVHRLALSGWMERQRIGQPSAHRPATPPANRNR